MALWFSVWDNPLCFRDNHLLVLYMIILRDYFPWALWGHRSNKRVLPLIRWLSWITIINIILINIFLFSFLVQTLPGSLSIFGAAAQTCKPVVAERKHESSQRLRPSGWATGAGSARRGLLCSSKCHKDAETPGEKEHNTARLGCCFLLIGLIHRRIYKACYLNAIFFYQTITPFINTAARHQQISRPVVCRVAPGVSETAEFQIIVIILSVIDRNKPCNIHL